MKLNVLAPALLLAAFVIADPAAAQRRGRNPNAPPPKEGEEVTVSFAPEDLLVLESESAN